MNAMFGNAKRRGFTLIELMIVVAIIGILAVLAIYGVSKYLKTSKTAEATNNVGQMAKNAQEAFTREKMSGSFVSAGGTTPINECLCGKAASPVPATVPKSSKYTSAASDWATGDSLNGWTCLKYNIEQPQYYQYDYQSDGNCAAQTIGTTFSAIAQGDLDGNGTTSSFVLTGNVDATSGQLVVAPKALETNPEE